MSENDVNVIKNIKSQNIKILCNRCESYMSSLSKITTSIDNIKTTLETRLDKIESLINSSVFNRSADEDLITESVQRSLRAKNIILANVPENSGLADVDVANDILEVIDNSLVVSPDYIARLGTAKTGHPRLLRLRFKYIEHAKLALKKRDALKGNTKYANILVRDDKTLQQINYLKNLKTELQRRRDNGENNLTIKYKNNVPCIISTNNSNPLN